MDKLTWDLRQICNRNKDGAFGTQAARWRSLDLIARELRALGVAERRYVTNESKARALDERLSEYPGPRGGPQAPAELRRPGRPPRAQALLDQRRRPCSAAGGKTSLELTPAEKVLDSARGAETVGGYSRSTRIPSGRPACPGSKRQASPVSCTPFPPAIVGLPAGLGRPLARFPP